MLDFFHLPQGAASDIQVFDATSGSSGVSWVTWDKPRGASVIFILAYGCGGNGGNGFVGAASAAGGGGGGGSGSTTFAVVPAFLIPQKLYIKVGVNPVQTLVCINPDTSSHQILVGANNGGNGGNGTASVGGTAGSAGATFGGASALIAVLTSISLGVGLIGRVGGFSAAGTSSTLAAEFLGPGTGGGGLGAAAGNNGGSYTVTGEFPAHSGGAGGSSSTTPGSRGADGLGPNTLNPFVAYGGTGGGSSHGTATGAGLFGGNGGDGYIGCGGGGGGACLTGGTAGVGGRGGPGRVIIFTR